jgi:serine-type anaerobic sulfatase-maturating enzyme
LQKAHGVAGQEVGNSLQTNAILLDDDAWCAFLRDSKFLVGVSIDGPKELHDHYRLDLGGHGTWDRVMSAIERMKAFDVQYNTLSLINNVTADHPDEIFDFLIDLPMRYLQFIPCVEVDPDTGEIADFSVSPKQYGDFMCRIFDRWVEFGPQRLSIRDFDSILTYCVGGRHTICTFDKQCSQYIVIEHAGDVYPCDFFVEPKWHLGNIFETPIEKLAASAKKKIFARKKQNLCNKCLVCRHLAVCRGGCMKDRAPFDKDDYGRESYFCESYRQFFDYALPRFMQLAAEVRSGSLVRSEQLG